MRDDVVARQPDAGEWHVGSPCRFDIDGREQDRQAAATLEHAVEHRVLRLVVLLGVPAEAVHRPQHVRDGERLRAGRARRVVVQGIGDLRPRLSSVASARAASTGQTRRRARARAGPAARRLTPPGPRIVATASSQYFPASPSARRDVDCRTRARGKRPGAPASNVVRPTAKAVGRLRFVSSAGAVPAKWCLLSNRSLTRCRAPLVAEAARNCHGCDAGRVRVPRGCSRSRSQRLPLRSTI